MRGSYIIIIVILAVIFILGVLKITKSEQEWVSPNLVQIIKQKVNPNQTISSQTIPSPGLKTYHFDSTADLKKELESIDPQILDSDFAE